MESLYLLWNFNANKFRTIQAEAAGGQGVTLTANQKTECTASTNQKPAELLVMIYKSHQVASVCLSNQ